MKTTSRILTVVIHTAVLMPFTSILAQDWPQWRGANRDAKAAEFKAPKTWPKELPQKWKVAVGERVATPALVGDKLFVFSRQNGNEVTRCLDAATGEKAYTDWPASKWPRARPTRIPSSRAIASSSKTRIP